MLKNNIVILSAMLVASTPASAGLITSQGAVTALTDISQMGGITGTANFNLQAGLMPLDAYSAQGISFFGANASLASVLPGITASGQASTPHLLDLGSFFPAPIAGGGSYDGLGAYFAGIVTFTGTVTQFGLTASMNGTQYLTAWDPLGALIGQVTWTPNQDAAFVGIDTGGIAIGMLSYGNDDMYNGATYSVGGSTIMSDNWVWNDVSAGQVPEPTSLALLGIGLAGMGYQRRRKAR